MIIGENSSVLVYYKHMSQPAQSVSLQWIKEKNEEKKSKIVKSEIYIYKNTEDADEVPDIRRNRVIQPILTTEQ